MVRSPAFRLLFLNKQYIPVQPWRPFKMNPSRICFALAALLSASPASASTPFAHGVSDRRLCEILPPNQLQTLDRLSRIANLSEAEFKTRVDQAIQLHAPWAAAHGGHLRAEADWNDPTVNAYALQVDDDWTVQVFGGLARRPELTADGFSLILCHEIGHHLGGFPLNSKPVWEWGAVEGQADYFSTQACARTLWGAALSENATYRSTAPAIVQVKCDQAWSKAADQDLCYRVSEASRSLGNLYASVASKAAPDLATPDPFKVYATFEDHPDPQCRLDTLFHGALCSTAFDLHWIPGRNHPSGQGSVEAEQDAAKVSCDGLASRDPGARPRCWYRSQLYP